MKSKKEDILKEIERKLKNCNKCPLCKNSSNLVFGKGNTNANIVLIGEAPGLEENEKGIPFCGKSGKMLDNLLKEAGFNIESDIYFCNVVKCRPANSNNKDRKPSKIEIQACRDYLFSQIKTIRPQSIILCGITATRIFNIYEPMNKIHGNCFKYEDTNLFPVYHPRASIEMDTKLQDFKKIYT